MMERKSTNRMYVHLRIFYVIILFLAIHLATSCASKDILIKEYDSLEECRISAEGEVQNKINYALKDKPFNFFFYSRDLIVDNYVDLTDINCKYDKSINKWVYDLSGYIEFNYRYMYEIFNIPGSSKNMIIWSGRSINEKIPIK